LIWYKLLKDTMVFTTTEDVFAAQEYFLKQKRKAPHMISLEGFIYRGEQGLKTVLCLH
jgi:hypothetical protein